MGGFDGDGFFGGGLAWRWLGQAVAGGKRWKDGRDMGRGPVSATG